MPVHGTATVGRTVVFAVETWCMYGEWAYAETRFVVIIVLLDVQPRKVLRIRRILARGVHIHSPRFNFYMYVSESESESTSGS